MCLLPTHEVSLKIVSASVEYYVYVQGEVLLVFWKLLCDSEARLLLTFNKMMKLFGGFQKLLLMGVVALSVA